jgi:predicted RNase H-like HicB family nuclease
MSLVFTAVFEKVAPSDGGGYSAYAEELPGAISEGETLDEARENLRDAIETLLAANRELASKPQQNKSVKREKMTIVVGNPTPR